MTTDQKKLIFSSFIKSQFTYCPSIWIFFTKRSLRRIKKIHERCLHRIQENYISNLERLLENANEKSVHKKCIELLLTEVYKYLNGLSPDIMNTIFKLTQNTYNLRNNDSSNEGDIEIDLELTKKKDDKEVEASAPVVDDEVTSKLLPQDTACIVTDDD